MGAIVLLLLFLTATPLPVTLYTVALTDVRRAIPSVKPIEVVPDLVAPDLVCFFSRAPSIAYVFVA